RWKNFLLVLLLMPFLMPFLLRTLSWKIILADDGLVVGTLKSIGLLGPNATLLATSVSVIAGIAYNVLPFMALSTYVSLDNLGRSLIEAATDLYARASEAFRKVTLPLSMPGVVAGTLRTFIPAVGDYVNVLLLGSPNEFMIGNV